MMLGVDMLRVVVSAVLLVLSDLIESVSGAQKALIIFFLIAVLVFFVSVNFQWNNYLYSTVTLIVSAGEAQSLFHCTTSKRPLDVTICLNSTC